MKKILIVDDSNGVRQIVRATLDNIDYKVQEASNGKDAIEMAIRLKPDLIIMDVSMPGEIDGIEAAIHLKNNPETNRCKVIILSGSDLYSQEELSKAGICHYFVKPFSPLDLITKVEQILSAKK